MLGRTFTRNFKLMEVRQLASGEQRQAKVCREVNLPNSMVSLLRQEYGAQGEESEDSLLSESEALAAKLIELERFCGLLAWENSILENVG